MKAFHVPVKGEGEIGRIVNGIAIANSIEEGCKLLGGEHKIRRKGEFSHSYIVLKQDKEWEAFTSRGKFTIRLRAGRHFILGYGMDWVFPLAKICLHFINSSTENSSCVLLLFVDGAIAQSERI